LACQWSRASVQCGMARSLRVEYAGAYYHVIARGNRREAIFLDEEDRRFFLKALSEVCAQTGWRVHAWVILGNHYHLFIETPEANLVAGMKWLQNTYTRRFNVRHRAWGKVFGDRYKSVVVEGELPEYYRSLVDYIHLNPVRARIVSGRRGESVRDYPWSSLAGGYALPAAKRPKWLAADAGMERLGYRDTAAGRRKMVEELDRRARSEGRQSGLVPLPDEMDARMSHLRRGWYWGSQEFAERLRKSTGGRIQSVKSRAYLRSPQRVSHGLEEAERLVVEGIKAAGLRMKELARLPGGDPRKVALGKLVREKTVASCGWLAARLKMRSAANVSQTLRRTPWKSLMKRLPRTLAEYIDEIRR
jgi:putative transposase